MKIYKEYLVEVDVSMSSKNQAAESLQKWIKKLDRLLIKDEHVQNLIAEIKAKTDEKNNNYRHKNKFVVSETEVRRNGWVIRKDDNKDNGDRRLTVSSVFTLTFKGVHHYWEEYL